MPEQRVSDVKVTSDCLGCGTKELVHVKGKENVSEFERRYGGGSIGAFAPPTWKNGYCPHCQAYRKGMFPEMMPPDDEPPRPYH